MHKHGLTGAVVPVAIIASMCLKWCVGLGSYSGEATPPMFGDYEAQRHWMELTIHLPLRDWYTYDLQYWGLDYPPLTAYVSWLCGIIGAWINPAWFALGASRGHESPGSKVLMRATVLALDALVYVPALLMFVYAWQDTRSRRTQNMTFITLLAQPALLLIDFGHFQYNSVMLGLTLMAINFFALGHDLLGAICFVLSLGFKQMALYYAPAIGSYLLGKCIYLGPARGSRLFLRLALVTTLTFLVLFAPFHADVLAPLGRIFPFNRGLFEDKVANVWCASDIVVKWRRRAGRAALVKLSTLLTALGFLPAVVGLLRAGYVLSGAEESKDTQKKAGRERTPLLPLLPYALLTSSLSFFLFSFQVHEKTILVPLLPATLLLSASPDAFAWSVLINNVAVFSMWPLLRRDGQGLQYIALLLLWNRLIGYNPFKLPSRSFIQLLSLTVYAAAFALHLLELTLDPPARYPDLWAVLNVLVCTPVFALAWAWSVKGGMEVGWALGGLGPRTSSSAPSSTRVDKGVWREAGARTMSLGYAHGSPAQGGRRPAFRPASVGPDELGER
ncbi:glycosyltransferase family 57 protein [Plicaturopsis crispa FD-325 SS-3]|nr:glycosyltransferase family 57 protein [Plicaturopsis crispa FD-325 SS-3]